MSSQKREKKIPSVIFYKRMIALTLAIIILTLATLSIVFSVKWRHARRDLSDTRIQLEAYELAAQKEREAAEAERIRNAIPPELAKPEGERSAPEILAESSVVLHAFGAVDDAVGLNCLEGFLTHYKAGARVFEVDLRLTSDGYAVLRHDWLGGVQAGIDQLHIPTLDVFRATPINGTYTPLSFRDVLLLMAQYPDVCIITDTKLLDNEVVTAQFQSMVSEAHRLGMSYLFDRMIVQIYSPEHFTVVDGIYHFPHYIYTLYQDYFGRNEESFDNKVTFCEQNGILGLTLSEEIWDESYLSIAEAHHTNVYIHTINDAEYADKLLQSGVKAIYTDYLDPKDLGG
ncbi:MAG: hypothetical protein IKN81_00430 [Oscillospiraceae bacterium]|nr:hypothetical protein [Oscillospiraceae bacterium]